MQGAVSLSMMPACSQEYRHQDFGPHSLFPYATHHPTSNRKKMEISFLISDPIFRNQHQVLFLCQAAPG